MMGVETKERACRRRRTHTCQLALGARRSGRSLLPLAQAQAATTELQLHFVERAKDPTTCSTRHLMSPREVRPPHILAALHAKTHGTWPRKGDTADSGAKAGAAQAQTETEGLRLVRRRFLHADVRHHCSVTELWVRERESRRKATAGKQEKANGTLCDSMP